MMLTLFLGTMAVGVLAHRVFIKDKDSVRLWTTQ